mgnify:CR=1 FL=1
MRNPLTPILLLLALVSWTIAADRAVLDLAAGQLGQLLAQRGQLVHLLTVGLDLAVQRLALGGQGFLRGGSDLRTPLLIVVAGNLVVGAVIFLILTLIQFIVIAKGSERVVSYVVMDAERINVPGVGELPTTPTEEPISEAESVATRKNSQMPELVGVPLMTPVELCRCRPGGNGTPASPSATSSGTSTSIFVA